jgi:hypothetical protein
MTEMTQTLSRLWKQMTSAQRIEAGGAFWRDEQAASDQAQAVLLIAQQRKFRPKTVVSLDVDRKARHFAALSNLPGALIARALVAYHLAHQRPMMSTFLDALGIAHEDGLIQEEAMKPDAAKLGPAVARLAQQYPAADVSLYLNTLLCQDPEKWGGLGDVLGQLEGEESRG